MGAGAGVDDGAAEGARAEAAPGGKGADPMGGIMDMMKDMYDSGDDNMKKAIGEAMVKSRQNDGKGLDDSPNYDDDFNDPGKY